MNRRYFLMGATGALASSQMKSHLLGNANDTVRLAVVGVRGQGKSHLNQYSQMKNVEIATICDIDESILNDRLNMVEGKRGRNRPAIGRSGRFSKTNPLKRSRLPPLKKARNPPH